MTSDDRTDPLAGLPLILDTAASNRFGWNLRSAGEVLFLRGNLPYCRAGAMQGVAQGSPLAPAYGRELRSAADPEGRCVVSGGDGWLLVAEHSAGVVQARAYAVSDDLARKVMDDTASALESTPDDPEHLTLIFRHNRPYEGVKPREIEVPSWQQIAANYPRAARPGLDRLTAMTPEHVTGRLILLNGPPGTGKTTFLRALASAWRTWCRAEYIMDPDKLFMDSNYLLDVVLGSEAADKWQLLILEDCGELLADTARQETGQALSRLLNITDGLPGQGLKLLVVITSNEDLSRFHPSVVRPGRCLAQVEIGAMPYAECREWMNGGGVLEARAHTLAELIAIRDGRELAAAEPEPAGAFL